MSGVLRAVGTVAGVASTVLMFVPGGQVLGALGKAATLAKIFSAVAVAASVGSQLTAKKPTSDRQGLQLSFKLDPNSPIYYPIGRTAVGGVVVHHETYGTDNRLQTYFVDLGLGPVHAIEAFLADRVPVAFNGTAATGYYAGWMWQDRQLGSTPEPRALNAGIVDAVPGWSAAHKLSGHAAASLTEMFDVKAKRYANGEPAPSWIVQGNKVYDPRLDSSYPGGSGECRLGEPSRYVYSETPALHGLMWRLGIYQNNKRIMGVGAPADLIDMQRIVESANVQEANGWKVGGELNSGMDRWEALKLIEQAGGAEPIPNAALMSTLQKMPRVSVGEITGNDIVGRASIPGSRSRRERINGFRARFRSEEHGWEMVPIDLVEIADYVAADGRSKAGSGDYSLVQDKHQAAQLAAYEVYDSREIGPIELQLKPRFIGYRIGDALTANIAELGLVGQLVIVRGRRIDPRTGIVTLKLVTETAGKHAEALGMTGKAPPVPRLSYEPLNVPAPLATDWDAIGGTIDNDAGDTIPALIVTGAVKNSAADGVVFDFRWLGSADWVNPSIDAPDTVRKIITDVAGETAYMVGIRYKVAGIIGDRLELGPYTTGADSSASAVDRGAFDPATVYRKGNIVSLPDGSRWRHDGESAVIGERPVSGSDVWTLIQAAPAVIPPGTVAGGNLDPQTGDVNDGRPIEDLIQDLDDLGELTDELKGATIDLADAGRQRDRAFAQIAEALKQALLGLDGVQQTMTSAGITLDPASGKATIYGVDVTKEQITKLLVRLDAVEGDIQLKATRAYVDEKIAHAQLPGLEADLAAVFLRIYNAEVAISAANAAVALKADATVVSGLAASLTELGVEVNAVAGTVTSKADKTVVTALDTRVTHVQETLDAGDLAGFTREGRQVRYLNDLAGSLLDALVGNALANDQRIVQAAQFREEIYTKLNDDLSSEAGQRLQLTAITVGVKADLDEERRVRTTADTAEATARQLLAGTVNDPATGLPRAHARITEEKAIAAGLVSVQAGRVDAIAGQVNDPATGLPRAHARITDQATITAGLVSAQAARIDTIIGQVNDPNTGLARAHARITDEKSIAANLVAAEATARQALAAQFNDQATGLPAAFARIDAEQTARVAADSAETTARQAVSAQLNHPTTGLPAAHARVDAEQTARVAGDSAEASARQAITARLDGVGGVGIEQAYTATVNRLGVVEGKWTLSIDANGNWIGLELVGSQSGPGSLGLINTDLKMGTGRVISAAGNYRKVEGGAVGSAGNMVLWFGPTTVALGQETRANCRFALGTDGVIYYGGADLGDQLGGGGRTPISAAIEGTFGNNAVLTSIVVALNAGQSAAIDAVFAAFVTGGSGTMSLSIAATSGTSTIAVASGAPVAIGDGEPAAASAGGVLTNTLGETRVFTITARLATSGFSATAYQGRSFLRG